MNKKLVNIVLLIIYAIVTLVITFHHEIWGDEAQAWLVVRDLDFWGIIRHVRTEGHPLLWYFVLFPLAKLHLPVISMQILNWILVVAGAGLFVWKAPFSNFCKISVLCSSGFLYWFPALARSYCLIPLLLFSIAILYKKQKERPYLYAILLVLLANVHVIMLAFCTALLILFLLENKRKEIIFPGILAFTGILSVVLYLYGSQNENLTVQNYHQVINLQLIVNTYKNIIFNIYGSVEPVFLWIFSIFCITVLCSLFFKERKMLFVFIVHFLYQFCIFLFVWGIIAQRAYTILLIGLFCFWVTYEKFENIKIKNFLNILIALTFLFSIKYALDISIKDMFFVFSDGRNTASYIEKNIPDNAFIISNSPITTASVSAYLSQKKGRFFYDKYNAFYTYAIWTKVAPNPTDPLPLEKMQAKYGTIYVLMSGNCYYTDLEPIYASKNNVMIAQEKFFIYKIGK